MKFSERLNQWPRLAVTSVWPTDALVKAFRPRPPRVLMFNGDPVGLVDLAVQAPLMAGLDGLQHAGALCKLLGEILDAMRVPPDETLPQKFDRRLRLQLLLDDAGEAVDVFTRFCAELEAANHAAKNEATGGPTA